MYIHGYLIDVHPVSQRESRGQGGELRVGLLAGDVALKDLI